jgi:hypothetical protein
MIPGILDQQPSGQGQAVAPVMPLTGVRFDNVNSSVGLCVTSQSVTNSPLLTVSMFVRMLAFDGVSVAMFSKNVSDATYLYPSAGLMILSCSQTAGNFYFQSLDDPFVTDIWNHIFLAADMNHAAGSKICHILVNGVSVTKDTGASTDFGAAFSFQFNAHKFGLPIDQPTLGPGNIDEIYDFQSVWIGCGQYVDPANVGLFRDPITGLPKSLGTDGSGPTGIAPTYYFQGNAAAFSTNKGSGPAITLVGALTDAP